MNTVIYATIAVVLATVLAVGVVYLDKNYIRKDECAAFSL